MLLYDSLQANELFLKVPSKVIMSVETASASALGKFLPPSAIKYILCIADMLLIFEKRPNMK